jgi:hypothetical protein
MRLIAVLALCALTWTGTSFAAQQNPVSIGAYDCGEWVSWRALPTEHMARNAVENWVTGYLNGLAQGTKLEFWDADGRRISLDAAYLWIDNYCRKNPLDELSTALSELFCERTSATCTRN